MQRKSWPVAASAGLFLVWTLATYLFEGRLLVFLRPEAEFARLAYTLVANILIGTVGAMLLVRGFLDRESVSRPRLYGLVGTGRVFLGILAGVFAGGVFFSLQTWPSDNPVVFINAYSQVLVVSIAEVLVCWVALGGAVADRGKGLSGYSAAIIISAIAFGVYHFGHSPPFNTLGMVAFLAVVGLFTGTFYFATGSVYGAILFHNFLGMKGVVEALAARGALELYNTPQIPLIATGASALFVLVLLDFLVVRPALSAAG